MSGMDHTSQEALELRRDQLVDRALEGRDPSVEAEISDVDGPARSPREPDVSDDSLELAAARFDRATMAPPAPMPADVADRVRVTLAECARSAGTAAGAIAGRITPADALVAASFRRRRTLLRAAGGFAAAAVLCLVALTALRERLGPVAPATPTAARAALVSRATDLVNLRWQGTDHPDIRVSRDLGLVSGEVVWSEAEAQGFVRVCHLGVNDPASGSYRLWIWNADDPSGPPVASATFNVSQDADFTVVPIAGTAFIDRPVRASVTLIPAGTLVQRPDPADELLVASSRPATRRNGDGPAAARRGGGSRG